MIPLEVQGHTVPHLKALRYGIYETRDFSCGSTSSICQCILKSGNLLHKWGFVKTQSLLTVNTKKFLIGLLPQMVDLSMDSPKVLYKVVYTIHVFEYMRGLSRGLFFALLWGKVSKHREQQWNDTHWTKSL